MRIKDYNYDNIKNLKNPMGNYDVVVDFIKETFDVYKEYEGMLSYYQTKEKSVFCLIDSIKNVISFCNNNDKMLDDDFYVLPKNNQPYVRNQEDFNELKHLFLKYKLEEKLQKELVVNTPKRKVNKI